MPASSSAPALSVAALDASIIGSLAHGARDQQPSLTISVDRSISTQRLSRAQPSLGKPGYVEGAELGRGGLGVVIEATQSAFDRPVAIKRLLNSMDRMLGMRFYAEALIAARLEHPNIVPIHDLLTDSSGNLTLVMKRVEGRSWKTLLEGPPPSLDDQLDILLKVCAAVEFAHSRGILHCDLKPENVMIGDFGEVSVMDWGCALAFGDHQQHPVVPRVEEAERISGTPAYMAPEMVMLHPNRIGPASDVFLLGAILYELITRTRVHQGTTVMDVLRQAALCEIEPPTKRAPGLNIPDELASIAMRALAADPDHRTPSAEALATQLRGYRQHAQALVLAGHARAHLRSLKGLAPDRADQVLQRAVSAAENAVNLWPTWPAGRTLHAKATLAWARHCLATGGFTQAQALAAQAVVAARAASNAATADEAVAVGEKARSAAITARAHERHLTIARFSALAASLLVAVVAVAGFLWVRSEHHQTELALAQSELARATLVSEQEARRGDQRRFAPGLLAQARSAVLSGHLSEAEGDLAAAITFDPNLQEAVNLDAHVLASLGRYGEARSALAAWIRLGGDAASVAPLDQLCAEATTIAPDILATRLAELFVHERLPSLVQGSLATPEKRLNAYRLRIDQVWSGLSRNLHIRDDGTVAYEYGAGLAGHAEVTDISALQGIPFAQLDLDRTSVADLRPLAGMPLQNLNISGTAVKDLSPLRSLPLTTLSADGCPNLDCSTLAGLHLTALTLNDTVIADLHVLQGMPLQTLLMATSDVTDLAPLSGMPLHTVDLGRQVVDFTPLRGAPLVMVSASGSFTDATAIAAPTLRQLCLTSSQPVRLAPYGDLDQLCLGNLHISNPDVLGRIRPASLYLHQCTMPDLRGLDSSHLHLLSLDRVSGFSATALPAAMHLSRFEELSSAGDDDLSFLVTQPLISLQVQNLGPTGWRTLSGLRTRPLQQIMFGYTPMAPARFWSRYDPENANHLATPPASAEQSPALSQDTVGHRPGLQCEVISDIVSSVDELARNPVASHCTVDEPSVVPLEGALQTGLRFQGYITVPDSGPYQFTLASDDGSRLLIDGIVVVDLDGSHPALHDDGSIRLAAGSHRVSVLYFQAGGAALLDVSVTAPGGASQRVPKSWWTH